MFVWTAGFFLAIMQLFPAVLYAQSTFGTILGVVKDPASAVMVGVKVTVTDEGTNISHVTKTAESGDYEVTHLNPGVYRVVAESPGFQRYVDQHINLETGQMLRVDVRMTVGQVSETVTVEGQAPLVESETGTIADVRTGGQMIDLPLNTVRGDSSSGGVYKYVALSPGALRTEGAAYESFAGSRSSQGTYVFDGTSLGSDGGKQITPAQPSFETIQEMKVTMVNNSAEYGGVASVIIISKSGTNQLHGSAFHQYDTGTLNARNYFQPSVPFRVYNQLGGSIGGPVVLPGYNGRNRTFFFFAFEGNRDHGATDMNDAVPTLALRGGDFSQVLNSNGSLLVIRDPSNSQPFPGNLIPQARLSPVSLKVQNFFYPPPNFGPPTSLSQNLRASLPSPAGWNHFDVRMDHKISDANSLYGRFTFRNMYSLSPEGSLPGEGTAVQHRRLRNGTLADTHIISPKAVNELRVGFAWHDNRGTVSPLNGLQLLQNFGITGTTANVNVPGSPSFSITGFTSMSGSSSNRTLMQTIDIIDNVTFMAGRHSVKVGINLKRGGESSSSLSNIFGVYGFTNAFTGFSYADFLLGIPQTTQRTTPRSPTYGRNQSYAGYVQDNFNVHPKLTLNLGLRYEWMNPFADKYDRMFNFDPATGDLVVPTATVLQRDISPIYPSSIKIVTAEQAGFPQRGLRTADNNNFDPRFGFAWRPLGNARSVLRGGFGIFHNGLFADLFKTLTQGPFVSNETFTNSITNGVPLFQFPKPFLGVGSLGAQSITAENPYLFNAYTMQWNLSVEQQIASIAFRLSYIGTRSVDLVYGRNINQPLASVIPFNNNRRAYPQFNTITMLSNGASTIYHSMQFEAERKFAQGLYFQVGWTWAKDLGTGVNGPETGTTIQDAYNRRADYGDDLYIRRHRLVASYIWVLPFGRGKHWLGNLRGIPGQIVGDWRIAGITVLQTGELFTPSFTGSDPSNTNTVGGRPDRIANGNLPTSQRSLNHWFDASAFAVPPANAGRFGNSGIGVLEGPGTITFDLALYKEFRFKERGRVQLQFAATNALNHPNFLNPNANISAPTTVGTVTSMQGNDAGGPRTTLIATRIEF
jgi:hypothetical protein